MNLRVLDISGRVVSRLADNRFSAGGHSLEWNASEAPTGVYFVTLTADGRTETRPVMVTR